MTNDPFIPKGAIPLMGGLIVVALFVVSTATLMGWGPSPRPVPTAGESAAYASLTFQDLPDGGILVTGAAGERRLEPNAEGFIRGALRAMARQRRGLELGPEAPFVLALSPSGQLTLTDPKTNFHMDLRAFGEDNRNSFAALLPLGGGGVSKEVAHAERL